MNSQHSLNLYNTGNLFIEDTYSGSLECPFIQVLLVYMTIKKHLGILISTEAVGALWSLSFDENNKDMMINDDKCKVIDTFERLTSSEDDKVKDICRKALWTMREGLVKSTRYKSLGKYRNT